MKIILLLFLIVLLNNTSKAQTTVIPDADFEQVLIWEGYDFGSPDGVVLTANIDTVTQLSVNGSTLSITNMTGIEDFTALTFLHCFSTDIPSINLSQNILLNEVRIFNNHQLTSLDLSQNPLISIAIIDNNSILTSLDVSQNTLL